MNECPFCGGTLNCNNNNIWICEHCDEVWFRVTETLKQLFKILKEINKKER